MVISNKRKNRNPHFKKTHFSLYLSAFLTQTQQHNSTTSIISLLCISVNMLNFATLLVASLFVTATVAAPAPEPTEGLDKRTYYYNNGYYGYNRHNNRYYLEKRDTAAVEKRSPSYGYYYGYNNYYNRHNRYYLEKRQDDDTAQGEEDDAGGDDTGALKKRNYGYYNNYYGYNNYYNHHHKSKYYLEKRDTAAVEKRSPSYYYGYNDYYNRHHRNSNSYYYY
jgi:hypothetical protein